MQIKVNGATAQPSDGATILEILASQTLQEETIIVLLNGEIAGRDLWGSTALRAGDNIEIIRVVGGG
jgi:thiamine biosynthesis protein ThiS